MKTNKVFENASWISKKYKIRNINRKRDKNILHFVKAPIRRTIDKSFTVLGYENRKYLKAPYFRKTINLTKVESANINITGLGYFELYINGKKVGDDILSPPYSQYEKTVYYLTYDIKPYLQNGENVIGVVLGNGMYNVHLKNAWNYDTSHWRSLPKFIMSGEIIADEVINIVSDETWKVSDGPIISDDIYGGEIYDARLENKDWCNSNYDDSNWETAVVVNSPTENLIPLEMEPVRIIKEIKPVDYWQIDTDKWIFDLGINIAGFAKISAQAKAGTEVVLTYGEKINGKHLDMKGLYEHTDKKDHKYIQKDRYIFKGDGIETWYPKFTYHGFQYVEVSGLTDVDETTISGILVHNDIERIGNFSCSNELLNKIYKAGDQANINNVQGLPTDCPHREKNGWTGDLNLSMEYFLLNYRADKFFYKWLKDISDTQKDNGQISAIAPNSGWGYNYISGPVWDSTLIIVPWSLYLYRGDKEILKIMYPTMNNYMKWQSKNAKGHIITYGLGDWCSPNRKPNKPKAPIAFTSTAYHYECIKMMGKIADILGYEEDSKYYKKEEKLTYEAINKKFINEETGFVKGDCQTSYAGALFFDLVDDKLKPRVLERLINEVIKHNYHVDTGILGTKYLLDVLSKYGHTDIAYRIATQTDYPSWGNWIEQGATTLWENWNGEQSRNHRMFGSINSWFFNKLVGITIDENSPGFEHVILKPGIVESLEWVKGEHQSPYGKIVCEWYYSNDELKLFIEVPKESSATLYLDKKYESKVSFDKITDNVKVVFS